MPVTRHPKGTPLPDDHPLKGGLIAFWKKRIDSLRNPSEQKAKSSSNPMQGAVDAYEQAIPKLRRDTVSHKNTQSQSLDSTTPKASDKS